MTDGVVVSCELSSLAAAMDIPFIEVVASNKQNRLLVHGKRQFSHVVRLDNFGDEATNKDKVNLYRRGRGSVTWDTDANEDGIFDPRERMIDTDGDCTLDSWITPTKVGPVTIDCDLLP